jgi:ankyrin repeat protein
MNPDDKANSLSLTDKVKRKAEFARKQVSNVVEDDQEVIIFNYGTTQESTQRDISVKRIAINPKRDLIGTPLPRGKLHVIEQKVLDSAMTELQNIPTVLVDIFKREEPGSVRKKQIREEIIEDKNNPGNPEIHTICLWHQPNNKIVVVDPSSTKYSTFLETLMTTSPGQKVEFFNFDPSKPLVDKKFYKSDLIGPLKYINSRDCIDIAVKIGFQILKSNDLQNISEVEKGIKELSNQKNLNNLLKEAGLNDIISRELQSSTDSIREKALTVLNNNKDILKFIRFNSFEEAEHILKDLEISTFDPEYQVRLNHINQGQGEDIEEIEGHIRSLYQITDDQNEFIRMRLRDDAIKQHMISNKRESIFAEASKAIDPEQTYKKKFKKISQFLEENKIKISNADEMNRAVAAFDLIQQTSQQLKNIISGAAFSHIDFEIKSKSAKNLYDLIPSYNQKDGTELHQAVRLNNLSAAQKIIETWKDSFKTNFTKLLSLVDGYERSPLHLAAIYGDEKMCSELLKHMNPEHIKLRDHNGYTALHLAIEYNKNKVDFVKLILGKSNETATVADRFGITPFTFAVDSGNFEIAELLPAECLMTANKLGHLPIHTIIQSNNLINLQNLIKLYEDKGHKIEDLVTTVKSDDGADYGNTIMHIAAAYADKNTIEHLTDKYPGLLLKPNNYGHLPIHIAIQSNNLLNLQNLITLYEAKGHKVEDLVTTIKSDGTDYGNTIMHVAAAHADKNIVEYLTDNYQELIDTNNKYKQPPIEFAIYNNKIENFKILYQKSKDPDILDKVAKVNPYYHTEIANFLAEQQKIESSDNSKEDSFSDNTVSDKREIAGDNSDTESSEHA